MAAVRQSSVSIGRLLESTGLFDGSHTSPRGALIERRTKPRSGGWLTPPAIGQQGNTRRSGPWRLTQQATSADSLRERLESAGLSLEWIPGFVRPIVHVTDVDA